MKLNKTVCLFGTRNFRTFDVTGKLEELVIEMERLKWNVLGLSEVRWVKSGEKILDEGHKFWYSGEEKKHVNGVGFLVHKDNVENVLEYNPVSCRINTLPQKLTIIHVYAPTSAHTDDETEPILSVSEQRHSQSP